MILATDIEDRGRAAGPTGTGSDRPRGRSRDEVAPARRCIVTRAVRPREELLRFVVGPDGVVAPDMGAELPGRGIWMSARREVLEKACSRNAFSRAARAQVQVPPGLPDIVEALLAGRCLRLLGFARRAGAAVGGFEKVQEWVRAGRVKLLLAASDGSSGGKRKLRGLARAVPVIELLDSAELGSSFGRDNVVNVAVAPGGLARRLEIEMFRLSGFRSADERN